MPRSLGQVTRADLDFEKRRVQASRRTRECGKTQTRPHIHKAARMGTNERQKHLSCLHQPEVVDLHHCEETHMTMSSQQRNPKIMLESTIDRLDSGLLLRKVAMGVNSKGAKSWMPALFTRATNG